MPAYSSTGNRTVLYVGDAQTVWNAEKPATGVASMQVALSPPISGDADNISVQVTFSGDPGTFEIDIQTADAPDVDASYVTSTTKINSVNSGFVGNAQIIGLRADFVRLLMENDPANNVSVTATITR